MPIQMVLLKAFISPIMPAVKKKRGEEINKTQSGHPLLSLKPCYDRG